MKAPAKQTAWALVGAAALLGLGACASVGSRVQESTLGLTCVVVDTEGRPIEGADVVLRLSQATTPVREERKVATSDGRVAFTYTTDPAGTPYMLTASKAGYESNTLAGVATPGAEGNHHRVTLFRVSTTR